MNNTMVRKIRGAKINPKSSFKNQGAQNTRGWKLCEQIWYFGLESDLFPQVISCISLINQRVHTFSITYRPIALP